MLTVAQSAILTAAAVLFGVPVVVGLFATRHFAERSGKDRR